MRLIRIILDWAAARGRALDIRFLWPSLKVQAETVEMARHAFLLHALRDPAWRRIGEEEAIRIIGDLD